jgi:Ca2+-binding EF-hand superfamily protein
MFRGHNPTEAEVQDMINETDTNNTGQVQWVSSLLNLYSIKVKNIYLDKR